MKTFRNYMENERKKNILFIIAVAVCIVFSGNIFNSIESYKYRRLCDQYREQLDRTEKANKELADRIGRITEITGRIKKTAERNVTDARGIVETVEILRSQIQELENICYGSDSIDSYYNYWDSYFRNEELIE